MLSNITTNKPSTAVQQPTYQIKMPGTTTSTSSSSFLQAVQERRTYYALNKKSSITDTRIQEIITTSVKHAPSSFNSQSARAVLLLNEQHDKLWDIVLEILKAKVSSEQFPATQARIDGFKNAHGTVLYFEDQNVVQSLQEKFPSYKDKYVLFSLLFLVCLFIIVQLLTTLQIP